MGRCFLHGNGGSSPLDFKIVGGTTEPSGPRENTIWVNTDTDITSWFFSANEPESPMEGTVWFKISTSCAAPISVTKKNPVMVYPVFAFQYIDGSFVSTTAKTYQNGAWVEWFAYLYNNGDECTDLTGGWSAHYVSSDYYAKGTLTKHDTYMFISCSGTSGLHVATGPINLSSYEKLTAIIDGISINAPAVSCLQILPDGFSWAHEGFTPIASTGIKANGTFEIDVSNLSGSYYVGFQIRCTVSSQYGSFNIREVYLQ